MDRSFNRTLLTLFIFTVIGLGLFFYISNWKYYAIKHEIEYSGVVISVYPRVGIENFPGVENCLDIVDGNLILIPPTEQSSEEHKKAWIEVQSIINMREMMGY